MLNCMASSLSKQKGIQEPVSNFALTVERTSSLNSNDFLIQDDEKAVSHEIGPFETSLTGCQL